MREWLVCGAFAVLSKTKSAWYAPKRGGTGRHVPARAHVVLAFFRALFFCVT